MVNTPSTIHLFKSGVKGTRYGVGGFWPFCTRTHPSGLNLLKGSRLCNWLWPIASRTHLVLQALEDQTPLRLCWTRHQILLGNVMVDIAAQKSRSRVDGFERRKAAHLAAGEDAGLRAAAHLLEWLGERPAPVVSGYMPIRTEINVLPAMNALFERGHRICVPVIIGKGKPLEFREWTPVCKMVDGPFGARVPEAGEILAPDLLLCPLVSFDLQGQRMGYGGGFYDRSLAELRGKKPVLAVGYAYAGQQAGTLPTEQTDQPLDAVITETGVVVPGQAIHKADHR